MRLPDSEIGGTSGARCVRVESPSWIRSEEDGVDGGNRSDQLIINLSTFWYRTDLGVSHRRTLGGGTGAAGEAGDGRGQVVWIGGLGDVHLKTGQQRLSPVVLVDECRQRHCR